MTLNIPDGETVQTPDTLCDPTAVFSALADPVRSKIVERLALEGAMTVGQLSEPFSISAPAISRHLNILEQAGILQRTVDRQWRVCSLRRGAFDGAAAWLYKIANGESAVSPI